MYIFIILAILAIAFLLFNSYTKSGFEGLDAVAAPSSQPAGAIVAAATQCASGKGVQISLQGGGAQNGMFRCQ